MVGHAPARELRSRTAPIEAQLLASRRECRILRAQNDVLALVVRYLTGPSDAGQALTAVPAAPSASGPGP